MPFTVAESEKSELAVVFAALILHDDKAAVSGDNIAKILAAAKSTFSLFMHLFSLIVSTFECPSKVLVFSELVC